MIIKNNIDLKPYNTFGISALAKTFVQINHSDEIPRAVSEFPEALILGRGSNVLFIKNTIEQVIQLNNKGIDIIRKTGKHVWIRVQSGEIWHDFVMWSIENGYGGAENLALIPGNTGTAPIQNIGAYGREVKDIIEEVETIDKRNGERKIFQRDECGFGYRTSVFKTLFKNKYVITSVTFKLDMPPHKIYDTYGSIRAYMKNIKNPGIKDVARAVIEIRQNKLPDPEVTGNAGSFFKNPVISIDEFNKIQKEYPEIPHYPAGNNNTKVKLAAGWLIDHCGLKGYRIGDAGVHDKQALVLVNHGNALGKDIVMLAKHIQKEVSDKFGIKLEPEVNWID